MKDVVTLRNYTIPEDLEREVGRFVEYYNHKRVHESLGNLTPADVYDGRGREIQTARWRLKKQTFTAPVSSGTVSLRPGGVLSQRS